MSVNETRRIEGFHRFVQLTVDMLLGLPIPIKVACQFAYLICAQQRCGGHGHFAEFPIQIWVGHALNIRGL